MGSAANQVARNGPGGQRFGVTARCNAGTGNCERIESGCKAARCTNLQCGDRRDISAPQLRGNIPSVPVLPGKGNPDGCVSYKAPARNAKTNQRMRPDAVASAIFSHVPVPTLPRTEIRSTSPRSDQLSLALRPDHALILLRNRAQAAIHELLHALAAIRLGREDVTLRIRGDAMNGIELSRLAAAIAEAGQLFERVAQQDVHLH